MHPLRLIPALLAMLLILAACAGQPAAETMDAAPAPQEAPASDDAMAEGDMADDDMAEGDMAEDERADDDMADDDMADDDMDDDDMDDDDMDDDDMDDDDMDDDDMDDDDMDDDDQASVDRPAWQQIALVDARTGEAFTLADSGDKPVFVEPFATWCSNCRRQLGNVQQAHAELGDEAVFVALSVEPNIGNEALVDYADKEGFAYTFAAMPPEMLQELAALFGQTVSNPPATPHFIIWPDGSTTDLSTGFEAPEAIVELRSAG